MPLSPKARLLAAVLAVVALGWFLNGNVEHAVYAMEYTAGTAQASVETWALPLPDGYALVYWKSTPHSAQDGIRIFQRR